MENWPIHLQYLFNQAHYQTCTLNKTENYFLVFLLFFFLLLLFLFSFIVLCQLQEHIKTYTLERGCLNTNILCALRFSHFCYLIFFLPPQHLAPTATAVTEHRKNVEKRHRPVKKKKLKHTKDGSQMQTK